MISCICPCLNSIRQNPITIISPGIFCLTHLQTLSFSSCQLISLPYNNSSPLIVEEETQVDTTQKEDDMEYEYEDPPNRRRNYEDEYGLRNWSSFVMYYTHSVAFI